MIRSQVKQHMSSQSYKLCRNHRHGKSVGGLLTVFRKALIDASVPLVAGTALTA